MYQARRKQTPPPPETKADIRLEGKWTGTATGDRFILFDDTHPCFNYCNQIPYRDNDNDIQRHKDPRAKKYINIDHRRRLPDWTHRLAAIASLLSEFCIFYCIYNFYVNSA